MKTEFKRFKAWVLCAWVLGMGGSVSLGAAVEDSADTAFAKVSMPWSQIGTKAGADYQGDGLAVSPIAEGARLRCVFQRLEGEVTREGLWLISTVTNAMNERFRVTACSVGRVPNVAQPSRMRVNTASSPRFASSDETSSELAGNDACATKIARTGTVEVADRLARFLRPRLIEQYSVSMDGVRQDFVIERPPGGTGELVVHLTESGAQVEPAPFGARLVLENSGREIAYSRLRVTDATGKELTARMEVTGSARVRRAGSSVAPESLSTVQNGAVSGVTTIAGGLRAAENCPPEACGSRLVVLVDDADAVYPDLQRCQLDQHGRLSWREHDDLLAEGNETFSIQLANPIGGATLGDPAAVTVTLLDDDTELEFVETDLRVQRRWTAEDIRAAPVGQHCQCRFRPIGDTRRHGAGGAGLFGAGLHRDF